jgi:hypothetical protein
LGCILLVAAVVNEMEWWIRWDAGEMEEREGAIHDTACVAQSESRIDRQVCEFRFYGFETVAEVWRCSH